MSLPTKLAIKLAISLTDRGVVPDAVIRLGIRHFVRQRLKEISCKPNQVLSTSRKRFIEDMASASIAMSPEKANSQHYELPTAFFRNVLGPHLKYSSAYWPAGVDSLSEAEERSLWETTLRAGLHDGQRVLELGCGWGSLTLWVAQHFPRTHITAVSNSRTQKNYIESESYKRGLNNLTVIQSDMNEFDIEPGEFDRVVSVEMFEHMRNWSRLFSRVHKWLKSDGQFFMHIFSHRTIPYLFEVRDASDWMSEHFFSGGMMPSTDLPLAFQDSLRLVRRWRWDGTHYEKTANAWLKNMDTQRETLWPLFEKTYGTGALTWWTRWRIFFMSCAELFGYHEGREWCVSHYLFQNSDARPRRTSYA